MYSTADLPDSLRVDPIDPDTIRAVRDSGLILAARCLHRRVDCPACIAAAARRMLDTPPKIPAQTPVPVR